MSDKLLIWIVAGLLVLSVPLRIYTEKLKGQPMTKGWILQSCLFPLAAVIAAILFQTDTADILIPVIVAGIAEELLCRSLRRRTLSDKESE